MTSSLGAFVHVENKSDFQWSPPSSWRHEPPSQSGFELNHIKSAKDASPDTPRRPVHAKVPASPASTRGHSFGHGDIESPSTTPPNELETTQPSASEATEITQVKQSWNSPKMNKWRVLAACLINFAGGSNDSGMPNAGKVACLLLGFCFVTFPVTDNPQLLALFYPTSRNITTSIMLSYP